jgi:hypothetical protein
MEASKLKNFIIIVLLLVNITFGAMFLLDMWMEHQTAELAVSNTIAAFQNAGIVISRKTFDILKPPQVNSVIITRRLAEEMAFVETLLGSGLTAEDRGGNIMYYSGPNGNALIRGDGSFEVTLPQFAATSGDSAADAADGLLKELNTVLGLEMMKFSDDDTLMYRFMRSGFEVFNQTIEFEFTASGDADDSTDNAEIDGVVIRGNYTFGVEYPTTTAENDDDITSLFKFLREIEAQGILCTEVTAISNGWVFTANEYVLAKAFETDSGTYLLTADELVNITV